MLLPRGKAQIAKHYPGTKFAITEYNYGGAKVISGALAQADVLGIFGRQNLFAANNFGLGPDDVAQLAGFRAFINFDGRGAKFGDLGLPVTGETPSENSVYAARDGKNRKRLTVVAINKAASSQDMSFRLNKAIAKSVRAFVVTDKTLAHATPTGAQLVNGALRYTAPAQSVTTFEVTLK